MKSDIRIEKAVESDLEAISSIHEAAFEEEDVAGLTRDLLDDESAQPRISLLAVQDQQPIGHILFTRAQIGGDKDLTASILAPLGVIPEHQKKGIGGLLIRKGLQLLSESAVDLVFVLGHIEYYPRFGFIPAAKQGLIAPYPIPEEVADAWMVQELRPGVLGKCQGKIICARAMDKPEHWQE